MPETFLDSFIRITKDDELQELVASNMDKFKKLLTLYDDFKLTHRFLDEDDLLDDPLGCFQC